MQNCFICVMIYGWDESTHLKCVFCVLGSRGLMADQCQILNSLTRSPFTSLSSLSKTSTQHRQMTNESQRKWSTSMLEPLVHKSIVVEWK